MDNSIEDARAADVAVELATAPRFEDDTVNLQELIRHLSDGLSCLSISPARSKLSRAARADAPLLSWESLLK